MLTKSIVVAVETFLILHIVNNMVADELEIKGAMASTAIVLT